MPVWPKRDPLEVPMLIFFILVCGSVLGLFGYRLLRALGHMP